MVFNGRSIERETLLNIFRLREGVKELDSQKSRDFLIILCKANISSLCLVYINAMAAIMAEVIVLEIEYCIAGFITSNNLLEVSFWN